MVHEPVQQTRLDTFLTQELENGARGSVAVSIKQATRYLGFVRAGHNGDLLPAAGRGSAEAKADSFLRQLFHVQQKEHSRWLARGCRARGVPPGLITSITE